MYAVTRRAVVPIAGAICLSALFLAQCDDSPSEPGPIPCTYSLSSTSTNEPSAGGTAAILVSTQGQCVWTATSNDSWLTVLTPAGTGSGKVDYRVAANDGTASRVGRLTIQNIAVTVTQTGRAACTYDVTPRSLAFTANGGNASVHVAAPGECAWTPTTTADWISIVSAGPGKGPGDVTINVGQHTGSTDRTAVLSIAGVDVAVSQTPPSAPPPTGTCDYTVSPTELVLHWHQTGGDVDLTTAGGCTWTVTPGAEWLNVSTADHGSGPASITFSHSIWTKEASRRAPLQVRWPTPTAGQNVWITQEGCRFALQRTTQSMPASGGSDRVTVFADPVSPSCSISCTFNAMSSVPWLRITSQGTGAGMREDGWINFAVDPNVTGVTRTGVIAVEELTLTITQAGS